MAITKRLEALRRASSWRLFVMTIRSCWTIALTKRHQTAFGLTTKTDKTLLLSIEPGEEARTVRDQVCSVCLLQPRKSFCRQGTRQQSLVYFESWGAGRAPPLALKRWSCRKLLSTVLSNQSTILNRKAAYARHRSPHATPNHASSQTLTSWFDCSACCLFHLLPCHRSPAHLGT